MNLNLVAVFRLLVLVNCLGFVALRAQFGISPRVVSPPENQVVGVGQSASFAVTVIAFPESRYVWQRQARGSTEWVDLTNGGGYSGANTARLTVANVTAAMSGDRFQCYLDNGRLPQAVAAAATLTVSAAPTITQQPANQSVRAGSAATFEVTAAGGEPFSYQWRLGGAEVPGATEARLTIPNAQAANAGSYSVVVTNSVGTVTSGGATLALVNTDVAPAIVTPPANQSVVFGGNATFSVAASGTAPLTFQWRKDGTALSGETNAGLTLRNVAPANAGAYSVVVTNGVGSVTSAAGTLTVTFVAPTITTQPVAQALSIGGAAAFTVVAAGTAPLSYQWRKDGTAIAGATEATFAIAAAQPADAARYTVVVTNGGGSVTSAEASLTVNLGPPSIVTQPVGQSVALGGAATLSVTASGAGNLTYQWSRSGVPLAGATNPSLVLANLQPASAGDYQVAVSNGSGTVVSSSASITFAGLLWATGSDTDGQAGSGNLLQREVAAPVTGGVRTASAGGEFMVFVKRDGTLWSVGDNQFGQLGDLRDRARNVPTQVTTNVTAAVAGDRIAMFIKSDGTVWEMGLGREGNAIFQRNAPVQLGSGGIAAVAVGERHRLFVKSDGTLWGLGDNDEGQLGDGSTTQRLTPVQVASGVATVAAGFDHSLFVKTDGTLWAMGRNANGQLGDGTTTTRTTPVQVAAGVRAVAAGTGHSLFVKTDGSLWAMGAALAGQLGTGTTTQRNTPVQVATDVIDVSAGNNHSLFVKTDRTLWAMGDNLFGQLGDGTTAIRNTPVQVAADVASVSAGTNFSVYVTTDGTLWSTGLSTSGQLGNSAAAQRTLPLQMGGEAIAVAGGRAHTLFVSPNGTLWAVGDNSSGQLGDGTFRSRSTPVQVTSDVVAVAAGEAHSLFIKSDRTLWAMGYGVSGQLGLGTSSTIRATPGLVARDVVAVAAHYYHSHFIKTDGTLWAMGFNPEGALGDGTTTSRYTPVQVATQVKMVANGTYFALWVKTDGTLWAVGRNGSGELGDGTTTNRRTPVQVATGVSSVAAANSHSVFLKEDGTVWGMGAGLYLGIGNGINRTTPVQIAAGVSNIGANNYYSVVLKTDGTLWATGLNSSGMLGDGTTLFRNSLIQVASNVTRFGTGEEGIYFVQAAVAGAAPVITVQPSGGTFAPGVAVTLRATATGAGPLDYRWRKDGVEIPGQRSSTLLIPFLRGVDVGLYSVVVTNNSGSVTSAGATVLMSGPPVIVTAPAAQTARTGSDVTLTVAAVGAGPITYQWRKDGTAIPGATGATLTLANAQPGDAGSYAVVLTNAAGTLTSNPISVSVAASARLGNISTRGLVPAGGNITPGFVLKGTGSKQLLIRAVGPTLGAFGVGGVLSDPRLELIDRDNNRVIATNDNWGGGAALSNAFSAAGAFALGNTSLDAALLASNLPVNGGGYTVRVTGAGAATTGVALVEIYDTDAVTSPARLVNVSTLGFAGTGAQVLTPGFVVSGTAPKRLLIRAVGPGLGQFGVTGTLVNPQLQVVPLGGSTPTATNDNWGGTAALKAAFSDAGAFTLADASLDAAVVVTLVPGGYTVLVTGVGNTTGTALVEVYDLDP